VVNRREPSPLGDVVFLRSSSVEPRSTVCFSLLITEVVGGVKAHEHPGVESARYRGTAHTTVPSWLWPYQFSIQALVVDSIVALLLMARFLLTRGQADGVFPSTVESRAVSIAFLFAAAFLVLSPVAIVLSAIPYGGGGVPKELKSLFAVTEAIGMYLLYRGLVRGAA